MEKMLLPELRNKILNHTAHISVIGLGYVGLPVAALFADAGFQVLGVEQKSERVKKINDGESPIEGEEPGLEDLLAKVIREKKFVATTDYSKINVCDVILIDVETPVDDQNIPRYEALKAVLNQLGSVMKSGALVIIESTIAPGTMEKVVCPLLEQSSGRKVNQGFYLGNCPERVMPGKLLSNLRTLGRVVGGGNPETARVMVNLYRHVVEGELDATDWKTAELVKTVENAYRDVQIAFANEVARICEAVGSNVWKVRDLVNKSPSRRMHLPGAGVGGHCIPKDPWLLAHGVKGMDVPLRMIPAARAVNDSQPLHMVELLRDGLKEAGGDINGARVLVLGYAYLENSDDTRNSPSEVFVRRLKELGVEPLVHDPYIREYQGDLIEMAKGCDALVVMVAHSTYKAIQLNQLKRVLTRCVLVDGRHVFDPKEVEDQGWIYKGIGL